MGQELRPYQQQARGRIHAEWEAGRTRTLLVLPTGTGKTIVFASVAADQVRAGDRVLILAHRGELLEQAADKLQRSTGLVSAVEKAESTCLDSWFRVVVGSVQTLQRTARLERFPQDYFGTIIIDEAHHAITDGYRRILDYFDRAKVLGVTATPDRGDMRNLGEVFDSLAFEYKLTDAIKEGYLCKIMAQTIPLKLDITDVGFTSGDYSLGQLGTALDPYLEQIAAEMAQRCRDRKTVVFLPLIKTSQKFRDLLNAHGFRAAEVNGQSDDRKQVLTDFEADKYNVLCNSMLLTEGWDCPSVDCVVVLRPTKVRSLYSSTRKNGYTMFPAGPSKEYLNKGVFRLRDNAPCALYALEVSDEAYSHALCRTEEFMRHSEEYSFNTLGLILCGLHIRWQRRRHYFCSQFVSEVLEQSALWRCPRTAP